MTHAEQRQADPLPRIVRSCRTAHDGDAVLELAGEIDMDTAPQFGAALSVCLASAPRRILVDGAAVSFCDCAGLNALLSARVRAATLDIPLLLVAPSAQLRRLMELTGAALPVARQGGGGV